MGIFKKAGEKIVDGSKKVVAYDEVKGNWAMIKDWAGKLNPRSIKPGRVETFQSAYERLGLDEETLILVYRNWFLRFYLTLTVFAIGFITAGYYILNGKLMALLPFMGFAAICIAQLFTSSFRMYQIRTRTLCPISEWLSKSGEWIVFSSKLPSNTVKKVVKKAVVVKKTEDK